MSGFGRAGTPMVSRASVVFTGAGDYTFGSNNLVIVKRAVAASTNVILPETPGLNCEYVVTDGKGDASTNNITIDGNGFLIGGLAQYVISADRGSVTLFFDGDEYHVIGERP